SSVACWACSVDCVVSLTVAPSAVRGVPLRRLLLLDRRLRRFFDCCWPSPAVAAAPAASPPAVVGVALSADGDVVAPAPPLPRSRCPPPPPRRRLRSRRRRSRRSILGRGAVGRT